MAENMKRVSSSDQEFTVEERNILSVTCKNVIGARRSLWRIVSSIEQKEESKGNETQVVMINGYHEKIESNATSTMALRTTTTVAPPVPA